jgi:acetolactate synthase-1/2/3 large subunit
MKVKIPDLIVETLSDLGVDYLFHLPGTSLGGIYGSLSRQKKIQSVLFKHEQGACFAAGGYSFTANKPGVCMVMNGPGVSNVVSAMAECFYLSVPIVVMTVDNPRKNLGIEDFHELDSFSLLAPITKKIICPEKAPDVQRAIIEALTCAAAGRPGPVYLNIPINLMGQAAAKRAIKVRPVKPGPSAAAVKKALKFIRASRDPVVFAGSGVLRSGAEKELAEFIKLTGIPVFTTLGGRGAVPEGSRLTMGSPSYTFDVRFLNDSDLFLVLGTRLNPVNLRMGMLTLPDKVVQVDTGEANPRFRKADIYLQCDIKEFLCAANREIRKSGVSRRTGSKLYDTYKKSYSEFVAADHRSIRESTPNLTAKKVLLELSAFMEKKNASLFTDSIWLPYSHLLPRVKKPRSFFCMRSYGCLGFALPSAIGACFADRRRKVVSLSGDGAFLFNSQELSTAATYLLGNFIQIIFNNSGYTSLYNIAGSMFPGQDGYYLWNDIDYHRLSESFGVKTITVDSASKINAALTKAFSAKGPWVINILTDDREDVKKPFWIE